MVEPKQANQLISNVPQSENKSNLHGHPASHIK